VRSQTNFREPPLGSAQVLVTDGHSGWFLFCGTAILVVIFDRNAGENARATNQTASRLNIAKASALGPICAMIVALSQLLKSLQQFLSLCPCSIPSCYFLRRLPQAA
jgi:hypothetical protein